MSQGLKNILIIILGFILGIILMIILRYNHQPLIEISIENQSGIKLTKIIIKDDELQNKYLIENLNTGDIKSISLYCRGEIGYVVNAEFESGDTLTSGEIYAETGFNDYFVVQKDTIIKTKFGKY